MWPTTSWPTVFLQGTHIPQMLPTYFRWNLKSADERRQKWWHEASSAVPLEVANVTRIRLCLLKYNSQRLISIFWVTFHTKAFDFNGQNITEGKIYTEIQGTEKRQVKWTFKWTERENKQNWAIKSIFLPVLLELEIE